MHEGIALGSYTEVDFHPSSRLKKATEVRTSIFYHTKMAYPLSQGISGYSRKPRRSFFLQFSCYMEFAILLILLFDVFVLDGVDAQGCLGHKSILTSSSGVIYDSEGYYSNKISCEWLIRAPFKNKTVMMKTKSIHLECQYDFLYIFDGGSYKSPLLATVSGFDILPEIVSTSNEVLVVLQTDYAAIGGGFKLSYEVTNCPGNCTGTGICENGKCICNSGYSGASCQNQWCPLGCSMVAGKGTCDPGLEKCICNHGFSGEGCSLPSFANADPNTWHLLSSGSPQFKPRSTHVTGYFSHLDTICIFGGRSLNEVFNDVLLYNISTNAWLNVTPAFGPVGRFHHASSVYGNKLVVFGGEMRNGSLLNDLWMFDTLLRSWSQPSNHGINKPAKLAGHTANVVGDKLYIIGGRTELSAFSSDIYEFDLRTTSGWRKLQIRSGKSSLYRFCGHSSVYSEALNSLLIYGGEVVTGVGRDSTKQNRIFAFNLVYHVWTALNPDDKDHAPPRTAFHTSVVTGDYMVVYGGILQSRSTKCFANSSEFSYYNIKCNRWVDASSLGTGPSASSLRAGRMSHTAVLRGDQTMVVAAGFNGVMFGDVHAYRFPEAVIYKNSTGNAETGKHCHMYAEKATCFKDPACGWCFEPLACFPLHNSTRCTGRFDNSTCVSHCSAFSSCDSCLLFGSTSNGGCYWCVQSRKCYSASSKDGCSSPGWWRPTDQLVTDLGQCYTKNHAPGITYIRYREPFNFNMPDSVAIVGSAGINEPATLTRREASFITGFVYPYALEANPAASKQREVKLSGIYLSAKLFVSTDHQPSNKEEVAFFPARHSQQTVIAKSSSRLFPSPTSDAHYFMQCSMTLSTGASHRRMVLSWNATGIHEEMSSRYLRPYFSGSCVGYVTCMACITDASCGWCPVTSSCLMRSNWFNCRGAATNVTYLVTEQALCTVCTDFYDCTACVNNSYCAWSVQGRVCSRKGLGDSEITRPSDCPSHCHNRPSCGSCLVDNNCRWCYETKECFPPSYHMARYTLGQCHVYSIKSVGNPCYNCSEHRTCASCLSSHRCGWCSTTNNPLIGSCYEGDFSGPATSGNCSTLLALNETVSWSYGLCPDADECRLKLDGCHENSTCVNTYGSYNCICNRGFTGDGKVRCNKTCYHECQHGYCGSDYQCKCDLGWKGTNCSIDCLCNGHSTCKTAVGICDKCHDYTTGSHCDECVNGSYGNPKFALGCSPCRCNGHGDVGRGTCDNSTGKCFCKDQTTGSFCQNCESGLLGNPRNGGMCYYGCSSLTFIKNEASGTLASGLSGNECVWVISATNRTQRDVIYSNAPASSNSLITLKMRRMDLPCTEAHLYVYDGIPGTRNASLVAVVCGYDVRSAVTVVAHSGVLTVQYKGRPVSPSEIKFYASFNVHTCAGGCTGNRHCTLDRHGNSRCLCKPGWMGVDCQVQACPKNCSNATKQGYCDHTTGRCICNPGFVGPSCAQPYNDTSFSLEDVTCRDNAIPARFGHTMLMDTGVQGRALVYGGRGIDFDLDENVWAFDLVRRSCVKLPSIRQPIGRYYHCGVIYREKMIVYGGKTKSSVSNEMLTYDVATGAWNSELKHGDLPPLYGHTCTLAGDVMYIIGGFIGKPLKIQEAILAVHLPTWTLETVKIKKFTMKGIFAHSAAYDRDTRNILVFGGVAFSVSGAQVSDRLWGLDLLQNSWSEIQPTGLIKPFSLFGHSASIMNDTMYIVGGYSDFRKKGFNHDLLLWKMRCNRWLTVPLNDSFGSGEHLALRIPSAAQSLLAVNQTMYYFGGYNIEALNRTIRITPPNDTCRLIRTKRDCLDFFGCNWCDGICFGIGTAPPAVCNSTHAIDGVPCTSSSFQAVNCSTLKSCSTCVSRLPGMGVVHCMWDIYRGCLNSTGSSSTTVSRSVDSCFDSTCQAASCDTCIAESGCIWTQYFMKEDEITLRYKKEGTAPWNCFHSSVELSHAGEKIYPAHDRSPPALCPTKCSNYQNCSTCLSSKGEEGGTRSCLWSQKLRRCFPPSMISLVCMTGDCGRIHRDVGTCPAHCGLADSCDSCLKSSGCGWCARPGVLGQGVCQQGDSKGSRAGICSVQSHNTTGAIWAPLLCPLENECLNGRHNCSSNEFCIDLEYGFECKCKPGYERQPGSKNCVPICLQGCDRGSCVRPNVCECMFGWTSNNCSVPCLCNGHSNCPNESRTDICLECHNNTQGPYCGECKAEFVGDPTRKIPCTTCLSHCNGRSSICVSRAMKASFPSTVLQNATLLQSLIKKGPTDLGSMVCLLCGGNSEGNLCEKCIHGFFKKEKSCRQCQCNGHGANCDAETGAGCICKQNTRSEEKTWSKQCNKCKSSDFYGNPLGGRQCFRKLKNEQSFTIGNEKLRIGSDAIIEGFPPNRTMFFAVPPRFTNVDIRLTIDVLQGGLDLYIATTDGVFVVDVNHTSEEETLLYPATHSRAKRNVFVEAVTRDGFPEMVTREDGSSGRFRRHLDPDSNISHPTTHPYVPRSSQIYAPTDAPSMYTEYKGGLYLVREIQRRVIIGIRHQYHNFGNDRFYIGIVTRGNKGSASTAGLIYFQQELSQIDLFVFFTVFFSVFFLILSLFFLLWKVKQLYHGRQTEMQQQIALVTMASRPFSSYTVQWEHNETFAAYIKSHSELVEQSVSVKQTKGKRHRLYPMAIEFTEDELAAVGTVFVQYPENEESLWNISLGSAILKATPQHLVATTISETQKTTRFMCTVSG